MKLDLLLFGRITSGPFFALLVKDLPPEGGSHREIEGSKEIEGGRKIESGKPDADNKQSTVASAFRRKDTSAPGS
jgi:hypothetical protein